MTTSMRLLSFRMPPFCRTQWVSQEVKQVWEPRIRAASRMFYNLEQETVVQGFRKCTTTHLNPNRLDHQIRELAKKGLVFLPIRKVGHYNGFAHSHPPVIEGQPWNWYGVVSNDVKSAELFVDATERGDHNTIGSLLGYPECCRRFFNTVWMSGYIDPIFQAAENTREATKLGSLIVLPTNESRATSMLRYVGARISPQIPCSFDCQASVNTAQRWINLAKELKLESIDELTELLSLATEWNCLKGIAWVTTPLFRLVTNSVPCTEKCVVRKPGSIPGEAPNGLTFPWKEEAIDEF